MINKARYAVLDRNHKVVMIDDVIQWAMFFENMDNRRVDLDEINGHVISTVFLGMDHGLGTIKQYWFETMVFPAEDQGPSGDNVAVERYETYDQALTGHKRMVARYQRPNSKLVP